ncbi:MAG: hypothetical protein GX282_02165 [Campylobacteraceae bacterium]|nr:hypothetical protein [Campylobacteraceae bacterium]
MQNNEEIEALYYEISLLLEGVLYYAGVKEEKLQDAAEKYVEIVDDVLAKSDAEGVDEVVEVVNFMKKNYKEFFK